jgi:hypothetical protein
MAGNHMHPDEFAKLKLNGDDGMKAELGKQKQHPLHNFAKTLQLESAF